jgi:hypothetical protein
MLPDELVHFGEKGCPFFRVKIEGKANIFLLNTSTSLPRCMVAHPRSKIILKNIYAFLVSVDTKKIFDHFCSVYTYIERKPFDLNIWRCRILSSPIRRYVV